MGSGLVKKKAALFIEKIKRLNGDPHYIALGMAIGVFIAITPTMPFHTILAITLALFLKASKPAAVIGVWVSNPFTVVFLYLACYKVGYFFFDLPNHGLEAIKILINHFESDIEFSQKIVYFIDFMETHIKMFMIMNLGGIVLGLPSALTAYYLTKRFVSRVRRRRIEKKQKKSI